MLLSLAALLATAYPIDTWPPDLGAVGLSTAAVASTSPTNAGEESTPQDAGEEGEQGKDVDQEESGEERGKGGRGKRGSGLGDRSSDDRVLNA